MNVLNEIFLLTMAQAPVAPPTPAPASLEIDSVFDFFQKGGWAMIPIGLCSLVALAIIIERLIVVRRGRVIPRKFLAQLQRLAVDHAAALEYCRANGSPIANVLAVIFKRTVQPSESREKQVEEAGQREVVGLRHHMRVLSVLPQVSTMLGLLGTIFGMIHTFQAVAASSEALGKTELLARGIYEAWTCTAAGLLVAIPVLVAYHYLIGRIDALVSELDHVAVDWLEQESARAAVHAGADPGRVAIESSSGPPVLPAVGAPA